MTVTALGGLGGLASPVLASTIPGASQTQTVLFREGFTGPDTPAGDWITKNTGGHYLPCLTAASQPTAGGIPECLEVSSGAAKPDASGNGAFEITPNAKGESGFGLYTRSLETDKGIEVDFDLFQHNAKLFKDSLGARGGDGVAFFLINGAASPAAAGDAGGSLGYRNLPGGIVGLGFDEFGNFSDPRWGGTGGPGLRPNSIVLRGADSTGYRYITGVKAPYPLAVDNAVARGPAKRHVTIKLSTQNMLSVYVNFFNGKGPLRVIGPIDLNKIDGEPTLPPTLKFGFAAATGAATAYHEVQGMTITGLPPDLQLAVSHSGAFKPGQTASFKLDVANDAGAGPTTGPATVTFGVPSGLTAGTPSGKGWTCSLAGQTVTCTRSDLLNNGASYPPITVPVSVASGLSGTLTASGTVSDPEDANPAGKTATDSVDIGALSPDITITGTHSGDFTPGGTGQYVFNVTNKPGAGPTTGPVTVTFPVPTGMTPLAGPGGDGWTCSVSGQTVTCTRGDVLAPGASYPPLTIGVSVAAGTAGVIPATATAATGDDANPQSVTAPDTVTIAPLPPDLAMALTTDGSFKAGGTGDYVMTVSNQPPGGPTNGPVTATFNVPAGLTVRSASGDGWSCSLSGQTVSCTRPGTGADAIDAGAAYPPVRVTVTIPNTASGPAAATATAGTPGDTGKPAETAHAQTQLAVLSPDVKVAVTAPPATAGDPATITLIATDSPTAGPVTGPTTITAPVPAGYPVQSVAGDGWQCKVQSQGSGQLVSCTRSDPLAPADSFPPVTITLKTPATASGQVPLSATGQTEGQPSGNTTTATLPIKAVPPALVVGLGDKGLFTAGQGGGSYLIDVSDDSAAGPVTGPVTVTFPLPGGMTATSASGTGWTCSAGQKVTCKRSDPLAPGASYPVITVATTVPGSLSGSVPATATASTTGPDGPVSGKGSDTLTIGQLAPKVDISLTPPDGLTAGGPGTYTLVASNEPGAGPTTGPTTMTFKAPDGSTMASAAGDGWQCTVDALTVSCTRSDILQPGQGFPPVKVDITMPDTASGTATGTGGVSTPSNGAGAGSQATTQTPVTPLPPDLTVGVGDGAGSSSSATAGNDNNVSVHVSDGPSAGPVTDPVTVTIPAPPGETPVSAGGQGWNCGGMNSDDGFICVNVGGLDPGQSYAPIDTQWDSNGDVTGTVPLDATGFTANQASTAGAEGTSKVTETPAAPDLNAQVVTSGAVPAGGTEDMSVDVSDAATAGPAAGGVTVKVPMPEGLHPVSAYGLGWSCDKSSQDVTCHRPGWLGGLRPGASYPRITVSGRATSPWDGGRIWATVGSD